MSTSKRFFFFLRMCSQDFEYTKINFIVFIEYTFGGYLMEYLHHQSKSL